MTEKATAATQRCGTAGVGTRASVADVVERFEDGRLNFVVEGSASPRSQRATVFYTGEVEGSPRARR